MDNPQPYEQTKKKIYEPAARRGACSFIHSGRYCIFQGFKRSFEVFDLHTAKWSTLHLSNEPRSARQYSNDHNFIFPCCVVTNDCLYTFGGWMHGRRTAAVHKLNLTTMIWSHLEAHNPGDGPFLKDKAGMVAYGRHMVCVFGGYGIPSWEHGVKRQKEAQYVWDCAFDVCWTNELHLFHTEQCVWISPETTGTRPPPCAAFTLTKVDPHRVVLFGGEQGDEMMNQLHILNMENWHWSGAIYPSRPEELWPSKRSFHTACSLVDPSCVPTRAEAPASPGGRRFDWLPCQPPDLSPPEGSCSGLEPQLFVLWGMDNNSESINDAWVFNVNSLTWKEVPLPACVSVGRVWHMMAAHHPTPHQAEVITIGGSPQTLFESISLDHGLEPRKKDSATSVLQFGISPLYQLCVEFVAGQYEDYTSLLNCLPTFVQGAVNNSHRRLCSLRNFTVTRL